MYDEEQVKQAFEEAQALEEDNLKKALEEAQAGEDKAHEFGLHLATAAQILQGMISSNAWVAENMIDQAVKYADELIERCRRD